MGNARWPGPPAGTQPERKDWKQKSISVDRQENCCFKCHRIGYYGQDCRAFGSESREHPGDECRARLGITNQVQSHHRAQALTPTAQEQSLSLDDLFDYSDSKKTEIHQVRVQDKGSSPRQAQVEREGVPATGVIDSWADVAIIGGGPLHSANHNLHCIDIDEALYI